jgi:transaldolase
MSIQSLLATGTKVWLDGVDSGNIERNRPWGITGATSNPTIVAGIVQKGHFHERIGALIERGLDDSAIAWTLDDELVKAAQDVFQPVWEQTRGDDGYVSFELDPLIEDPEHPTAHAEQVRRYVELGTKWSAGRRNRMIKVPATAAGLDALEALAAAGVTINVTLMFTERQYRAARDALWRGARQYPGGLNDFKSVYSIFVSRIDVYTAKHLPALNAAQGQAGVAIARQVWRDNREFWKDKPLRLRQEIVFASTGVKNPADPPDKYVAALAGGDIQTNPPATHEAMQRLNVAYSPRLAEEPSRAVLRDLERVDRDAMERVLIAEGVRKFVDPQKQLLGLIAATRKHMVR